MNFFTPAQVEIYDQLSAGPVQIGVVPVLGQYWFVIIGIIFILIHYAFIYSFNMLLFIIIYQMIYQFYYQLIARDWIGHVTCMAHGLNSANLEFVYLIKKFVYFLFFAYQTHKKNFLHKMLSLELLFYFIGRKWILNMFL